jgi:lipocalin-like protein
MLAKMLATAIPAIVLSSSLWAQTPQSLQGTWVLVSSIAEKDGTKTDQFGPGAKGMMSLDGDGRFMLTIIGPDLPRFVSNNRAIGTPEENKAIVSKSIAMLGTYSLDLIDKTLTFRVEMATFPNWNGTEQKRLIVTASREKLKYVTPTASSGGVGTVTWRRAR